eukprot:jgi/Bigna1/62045/fgenesh1_kg.29_\
MMAERGAAAGLNMTIYNNTAFYEGVGGAGVVSRRVVNSSAFNIRTKVNNCIRIEYSWNDSPLRPIISVLKKCQTPISVALTGQILLNETLVLSPTLLQKSGK